MPFEGVPLKTTLLPMGTRLFHGTDRPVKDWNPETQSIWLPAWFGLTLNIAVNYAKFQRSSANGKPYVIEFVTTQPLELLDASGDEMSEHMDELYDDLMVDEVAGEALAKGFEGWIIPNVEVMIGVDAMRFVKIHAV